MPETERILLIDRTEVNADGRGSFLKIYTMDGNNYRLSEKRKQLWDMFQNARHWEPILTIFATYNNVEYISNARPITDEILKRGIQRLGEQSANSANNERNRSTALSYAKDLVVADKIPLDKMLEQAQGNYGFIIGQEAKADDDKQG